MINDLVTPFFHKPRALVISSLPPEFFAALNAAAAGVRGTSRAAIRPPVAMLTPRIGKILMGKSTDSGGGAAGKTGFNPFIV